VAVNCLVNLSADNGSDQESDEGQRCMALELIWCPRFVNRLITRCTSASVPAECGASGAEKHGEIIDMTCVILLNLSQDAGCAEKLTRVLEYKPVLESTLHSIVDCFVRLSNSRHQLGAFLSNISQVNEIVLAMCGK